MKKNIFLSFLFFTAACFNTTCFNIDVLAEPPQFQIKKIDSNRNECCGIGDFNKDGRLDIVSGENIYYAPDWKKVKFREIKSDINEQGNGYAWDFMDAPIDVDGDGLLDVVTLSWHGKSIEWLKNPGKNKNDALWEKFLVEKNGNYESGDFFDVNGDGKFDEIVPNSLTTAWYAVEKKSDGTQGLVKRQVNNEKIDFGVGVGDINGDGRPDFVRPKAWFEAPAKTDGEWIRHPLSLGGLDGKTEHTAQILVYDVNGDGRNDIITSSAHRYGIFWYEQLKEKDQWKQHVIDKSWTQAHSLTLVDLDGNKIPELVTGKRFRAHNGGDPESNAPLCVYYYNFQRNPNNNITWKRNKITENENIGAGMVIHAIDIDNDNDIDLITTGKYGGPIIFENITKKK
ncbi:MAG: VCBS repeat-containing protein [Planctomycetaceae bacterium]|jgi:hypothetical protein|nr:VCBS repeat-containing protein [Planctomycetaceae bacterium]